jgi:hypothetical protein
MKLVRFGPRGEERPGIVVADGVIKDCSAVVSDYDHAFFATGVTRGCDCGGIPPASAPCAA